MDTTHPPLAASSGLDLERFRLRRFLAGLGSDELEIHDEACALADVARVMDSPKAVWFRNLNGEGLELVGNVAGSRSRIARALGVAPKEVTREIIRRLATKPELVEIAHAQAPVQQVVVTGDAVDLTQLPVHLQHAADGGLYISASIDFARDPRTGWTNVGFRRLMLRGRTETGIDLTAPSDLKEIYAAARADGPVPVSFVIGCYPTDLVAATMRVPVDELGLIASLRDAPLAVVKCVTNDLRVPADAEWVIEGVLDPAGHVEPEGPYGEFLGYYGGVKRNPVFRVTAITRRADALFQTASISGRHMERTDTAQLETVRSEVNVWRTLEMAVREPVAVYSPVSTGGMLSARVALRQRLPTDARSAILAVLGTTTVKKLIVVDHDIDIFSDAQVEWAFATRFQPDRDIIVTERVSTLPLDPSIGVGNLGSKVGFDLTVPFGKAGTLEWSAPEPPRYEGKRFPSLHAALEDGPKRFEELMAATASRDGREIVRALESLRRDGVLTRDEQGRYLLTAKR